MDAITVVECSEATRYQLGCKPAILVLFWSPEDACSLLQEYDVNIDANTLRRTEPDENDEVERNL